MKWESKPGGLRVSTRACQAHRSSSQDDRACPVLGVLTFFPGLEPTPATPESSLTAAFWGCPSSCPSPPPASSPTPEAFEESRGSFLLSHSGPPHQPQHPGPADLFDFISWAHPASLPQPASQHSSFNPGQPNSLSC
ncbi:unnamed protein product [Rangifer tarandus platyrhynchus]|uniref:Uncharacterized protein n=2 Tax=Rangifer tarandus platyrhynchus TaxID=3082113 RepID=A0ABN8YH83_RANTA|nr:unnamed protein product [Rangifer tarandus platyrhynchus]